MSILRRVRAHLAQRIRPVQPPAAAAPSSPETLAQSPAIVEPAGARNNPAADAAIETVSIADTLRVEEVADAGFYAGDLFRARFGAAIPDYPRHFVAFHRDASAALRVVSYIHYMAWEDHSWLCGGLCVDPAAYKRASPAEATAWKHAGGIGEIVLRDTLARLTDRAAVFGYCGDARQWQHDLNVGFVPAGPRHLLVIWNKPLPPAEQERLIERAVALGHF
jgi:hypothetical protein